MRTAGRCCTTDGKTSSAPSTPPAASFTVSSLNPCPKRPASYPQIPRTNQIIHVRANAVGDEGAAILGAIARRPGQAGARGQTDAHGEFRQIQVVASVERQIV